ncbi:hypothetical protein BGZ63DRAFT_87966 [Mariannaea sp. PMI_226]|nr:hypothetical protein BGZ63DRAFT_87966 [Mariannaea sp. PMI_226]
MANKVTEFACYAIRPGFNVLDETTNEGQTIARIIDSVLNQPGAHRVYYGMEVEDPSHMWLFLDWDSRDDHDKYRESGTHQEAIKELLPLFDFSKSLIKHVAPQPYPPRQALDNSNSPITEVLYAFFPADIDASGKDAVVARIDEFVERALKTCPDFRGISYGWSLEDDIPVRGDEEKQGVMLAAFIGWQSLEAHMKFRDTQQFKDSIGLLRTMPSLIKMGVFHVSCTSKVASK